jgi:hypothetical protein
MNYVYNLWRQRHRFCHDTLPCELSVDVLDQIYRYLDKEAA